MLACLPDCRHQLDMQPKATHWTADVQTIGRELTLGILIAQVAPHVYMIRPSSLTVCVEGGPPLTTVPKPPSPSRPAAPNLLCAHTWQAWPGQKIVTASSTAADAVMLSRSIQVCRDVHQPVHAVDRQDCCTSCHLQECASVLGFK